MNKRSIYAMSFGIIYGIYMIFLSLSIEIFEIRYNFSPEKSKNLTTILTLEATLITPLLGILVHKIGKKTLLMIISLVFSTISVTLFILLPANTEYIHIPIFLLSQHFAILNTLFWPMLTISVPSRSVGLCLTISSLFYSIGLSGMSLLSGFLVKKIDAFHLQKVFYLLLATSIFGLFMSLMLYFEDWKRGGLLALREDDERVEKMREQMAQK